MTQIKCEKCGFDEFKILEDVYSISTIPYPHYEIVCEKCHYGFVVLKSNKTW